MLNPPSQVRNQISQFLVSLHEINFRNINSNKTVLKNNLYSELIFTPIKFQSCAPTFRTIIVQSFWTKRWLPTSPKKMKTPRKANADANANLRSMIQKIPFRKITQTGSVKKLDNSIAWQRLELRESQDTIQFLTYKLEGCNISIKELQAKNITFFSQLDLLQRHHSNSYPMDDEPPPSRMWDDSCYEMWDECIDENDEAKIILVSV